MSQIDAEKLYQKQKTKLATDDTGDTEKNSFKKEQEHEEKILYPAKAPRRKGKIKEKELGK